MKQLLQVSLRQNAVYIPDAAVKSASFSITPTTSALLVNIARLGLGVSEELLRALQHTAPAFHKTLLDTLKEVTGAHKNWTPLVKGWDVPTGETYVDHFITAFVNFFQKRKHQPKGVVLPCGHLIPTGTFPLERYNGCPFCGTLFKAAEIEHYGQNNKQKVLELWTDKHLEAALHDLLLSKTALDATQAESLKALLLYLPVPDVQVAMKETLMMVIDVYIGAGMDNHAQALFTSPADILRYLWYKHTGLLQLLQPKTMLERIRKNNGHLAHHLVNGAAVIEVKEKLKLKYDRAMCLRVAKWLNALDMDLEQMCEIMHPKRAMWVRFIRALRLVEYGKRAGFEKLGALMKMFNKQEYDVWQGWVNHFRTTFDMDNALELLKQRPGVFARSLFSNMLWFDGEMVMEAFTEVADKVPARLLFTLAMYADQYFDAEATRMVKPLGGVSKAIGANQMIAIYDHVHLDAMKTSVTGMCMEVMRRRFAAATTTARTMYIDPVLFNMPVAIGDRSETVQDLPVALMGTRFPVEGDKVRLFMQWGVGLAAQHLDMDLSAVVAYEDKTQICSFSSLAITGCKHSGDIRSIPHKVGAAEYVELDLKTLKAYGAKYVTFTCNAYSTGGLTPMVIGWMNSKYPMKISERTGVAYDPSCVQHQVRVTGNLSKGLVFGVLDVAAGEVIWLEMPFGGQLGWNVDLKAVEGVLAKLNSKLNIGALLTLKAEAQGMEIVMEENADEVYGRQWAMNTAAVTQLLVD